MKRSLFETLIGALIVAAAIIFFAYSYDKGDVGAGASGYTLNADFSTVGGLSEGDSVLISGVKVGTVTKIALNPDTFLARVTMSVDNGIKLPTDTAAQISSESLLGGLYLALEPGAEEETLKDGGRVAYTQAPQNLEQLLGQFIFSMKKDDKEE